MIELGLTGGKRSFTGATFTLGNRIKRGIWQLAWIAFARWTPPPLHAWRVFLLNLFGARIAKSAHVYSSVSIWAPWNLQISALGTLGRGVQCYNIAPVSIGYKTVISQGVHLCTGTHDYLNPNFPLTARPISIGDRAWICADAFIGPGVTVGEGAILGAAGAAFHDLNSWTIYVGNPAIPKRARPVITDE